MRGEVGSNADCSLQLTVEARQHAIEAGVEGIHFTPGNPFWVRGGIAVYF